MEDLEDAIYHVENAIECLQSLDGYADEIASLEIELDNLKDLLSELEEEQQEEYEKEMNERNREYWNSQF